MNDHSQQEQHLRLLEALLFRAAGPVPQAELQAALRPEVDISVEVSTSVEDVEMTALMEALVARYAERGIRVVRRGDSWVMVTADDLAAQLKVAIHEKRSLSRAAMETLAIIAYYQPVTRAEIEEIRGVGLARSILDQLLETGWIAPQGHRKMPGRPGLWGTTTGFLHHFGLDSLDDLPLRDELDNQGIATEPGLFDYSSAPAEK